MLLLFLKSWEVYNFKVLVSSVQSQVLASSVQSPVSNALNQYPASRVWSLAFSTQDPASNIQYPVCIVQRPESSVQSQYRRLMTPIYFLHLSNVWSILHHWSVWRVHKKRCYLMLLSTFFLVFHRKIVLFIIFINFFDKVSNFCNRILTSQKRGLMIYNCRGKCMPISRVSIHSSVQKVQSPQSSTQRALSSTYVRNPGIPMQLS